MTIFLETKRLIIKAPELSDIDKIYLLDSDPEVMRYIGNGLPRSKEESRRWFEKSVNYYRKYARTYPLNDVRAITTHLDVFGGGRRGRARHEPNHFTAPLAATMRMWRCGHSRRLIRRLGALLPCSPMGSG